VRWETLDYHAAGEPLRILRSGLPPIPGRTMLEKRRYMRDRHDDIRRLVMLEPRGHADMYGAVLTGPVEAGSDCGVLFMHNEGYSPMCGHGVIALVSAALEHGLFEIADPANIALDTPAGTVRASARLSGGRVESVSFLNVPSFVQQDLPGIPFRGKTLDTITGWGGAFYAYADAAAAGLELEPAHAADLAAAGRELKAAVEQRADLRHPGGESDLDFLYGVIFVRHAGDVRESRNVCIFADGELDRSPTGTGISGRAAIHYAFGEIGLGEEMSVESITGERFAVECVEETRVGDRPAVVTRVTGSAYMTGEHCFVLDPDDPLRRGFLLR